MAKFILLFFCCVFSLAPSKGFAWTFTEDFKQGFYWGTFPISFGKFATSPSDGALLAQLTEEAQQEWENAVGREIWSMSPGYILGSGSGNHIRWSNNFAAETGYDPNSTLAVTVRYSSGTYFAKVEIILNGGNNELRNNIGGILKKTILHELGHTIGLDHSQQYSIMASNLGSVAPSLTYDDQAGANAAIDEHLYRQSIGYVSPLAGQSSNNTFGACGSVVLLGSDSDSGDKPDGNFITSLTLGLLLAVAFMRVKLPAAKIA